MGPAAAETIFDAGLRRATVEQFRAQYDETVANYRQTVLTAFQQVEDNLASLRILSVEIQYQDTAVKSAEKTLAIATGSLQIGNRSLPECAYRANRIAIQSGNCGQSSNSADDGQRRVDRGARWRLERLAAPIACATDQQSTLKLKTDF